MFSPGSALSTKQENIPCIRGILCVSAAVLHVFLAPDVTMVHLDDITSGSHTIMGPTAAKWQKLRGFGLGKRLDGRPPG